MNLLSLLVACTLCLNWVHSDDALSDSKSDSSKKESKESNYQICFELKDLNIYNIDYHSRGSAFGTPTAQIHLFDPSLKLPSIRSVDVKLDISKNKNITNYSYKLDKKLCWLNLKSTQLYFDFEIIQFYHMGARVGTTLNTGLNGSGLESKDFKTSNDLNMTTMDCEYVNVIINIKYEFEMKLLSKKEYKSLLNGTSVIAGSMMDVRTNNNDNPLIMSNDNDMNYDSVANANSEFNELSSKTEETENDVVSKNSSGGSSGVGMIFSAVVAAIMGFFALIGVLIYLYKMYSRKDYMDMDKQNGGKNGSGTIGNGNGNGSSNSDSLNDLGKLTRISLRDTVNKASISLKENKFNNKLSNKLNQFRNRNYDEIGSPQSKSRSETLSRVTNDSDMMNDENENEDNESGCIDVSIITNESHGLP